MSFKKHEVESLQAMKSKAAIPILTAYTAPVAQALEASGLPALLVGDTVGMVEMGFPSTRDVTIEHMQYHVAAVRRGAPNTHIIGDLPFGTDFNAAAALKSARLIINAGADTIKLEGPKYEVITALVAEGINVAAHLGLTPQTSTDFKKVGKDEKGAERVFNESINVENAGAFMVVLEHIPEPLAQSITERLFIPTIGIGAGKYCDGQVLVINDLVGLGDKWPPFSRQYAYLSQAITDAATSFAKEVMDGSY